MLHCRLQTTECGRKWARNVGKSKSMANLLAEMHVRLIFQCATENRIDIRRAVDARPLHEGRMYCDVTEIHENPSARWWSYARYFYLDYPACIILFFLFFFLFFRLFFHFFIFQLCWLPMFTKASSQCTYRECWCLPYGITMFSWVATSSCAWKPAYDV